MSCRKLVCRQRKEKKIKITTFIRFGFRLDVVVSGCNTHTHTQCACACVCCTSSTPSCLSSALSFLPPVSARLQRAHVEHCCGFVRAPRLHLLEKGFVMPALRAVRHRQRLALGFVVGVEHEKLTITPFPRARWCPPCLSCLPDSRSRPCSC